MPNIELEMISCAIEWSSEGEALLFGVYSNIRNITQTLQSYFGNEIDLVELVVRGDDRLIGQAADRINGSNARKAVVVDLRDEAHMPSKQLDTKIAFVESAALRKYKLNDAKVLHPEPTAPDPILDSSVIFVVLDENRTQPLTYMVPLFTAYRTASCILNQADLPQTVDAPASHPIGERNKPAPSGNFLTLGAGS